jgi:signal transduction histidine kinase
MPAGGRLIVETLNVDVDDGYAANRPRLATGPYAGVRVTDTGVGMDAESRDRAFEPFFTTKPRGSGTGLGLATVYGVVNGAGGDISITSEPGMGTTITILLPADTAGSPERVEAEVSPHSSSHRSMLYVPGYAPSQVRRR